MWLFAVVVGKFLLEEILPEVPLDICNLLLHCNSSISLILRTDVSICLYM